MKSLEKRSSFTGATMSRGELLAFIKATLGGQLIERPSLQMADFKYYLPSYTEAKRIVDNSKMKQLADPADSRRRGETFDCDDFSLILKARFSYAAYRARKHQNHPYCFGIVWGMLPFPFPHSMNWMVTATRKFYFIEPQRQKILPLNKCRGFRHINFMLV